MREGIAVSKAKDETKSTEQLPELPSVARRALAEAEARRREAAKRQPAPEEIGGRQGPDPARYGDWEVKGIASDF